MALHLQRFPVVYTPGRRISFHEGFADLRHGHEHEATDINAVEGSSIVSATDGYVVRQWVTQRDRQRRTGCGWTDAGGFIVIIIDRNNYAHYYAHMLSQPMVSAGAYVSAGSQLGFVSNTGSIARGSSPHLHYQVWWIGTGRDEEICERSFNRPFGRAVHAYPELCRLAEAAGIRIGRNGSVVFP